MPKSLKSMFKVALMQPISVIRCEWSPDVVLRTHIYQTFLNHIELTEMRLTCTTEIKKKKWKFCKFSASFPQKPMLLPFKMLKFIPI